MANYSGHGRPRGKKGEPAADLAVRVAKWKAAEQKAYDIYGANYLAKLEIRRAEVSRLREIQRQREEDAASPGNQASKENLKQSHTHFDAPHSVMGVTQVEDLEGARQAVEILANKPTTAVLGSQTSGVGPERERGDTWRLVMAPGMPKETNLHELMHVKETNFNVPSVVEGNPFVFGIWNAIEDGRIDRMGVEHFGKPLLEVHQDALRDHGEPADADSAALLGVVDVALGLPRKRSEYENEELAVDAFEQEIAAASRATDPAEPMRIAIRIGHMLDRLRREQQQRQDEAEQEKQKQAERKSAVQQLVDKLSEVAEQAQNEDEGEDEGEGEGGQSEGQGWQPSNQGSTGTPDLSQGMPKTKPKEGEEPQQQQAPAPQASGPAEDKGEEGEEEQPIQSPKPSQGEMEHRKRHAEDESKAEEQTITANLNQQSDERRAREETAAQSNRFGGGFGAALHPEHPEYNNHECTIYPENVRDKMMVPIVTDDIVKVLLQGLPEEASMPARARSGKPTDDIWKLNTGKLNVFERPRKTKGRLVVLVDMSGSMSDPCEIHGKPISSHGLYGGYLAWQIVGAVGTRYPDAEVFGFWTRNKKYIAPMPVGYYMGCHSKFKLAISKKKIGAEYFPSGDNTDCAALLWLREYLSGDVAQTTAIIITDGSPTSSGVQCDPNKHTARVAKEMYEDGIRYISIVIGSVDYLYPSEVTVHLDNLEDISKLTEAFQYLDVVRE